MELVPLLCLRLLGLGAVGSVTARGQAGGAQSDQPLTAGLLRAAVLARGHGAEPDSQRLPATDGGASPGGCSGASVAVRDLRRRSPGGECAGPVVRAARQ